jgi:hypothetical protein
MVRLKSYIIKAVQDGIMEDSDGTVTAPEDLPVFDDATTRRLAFYKDAAQLVEDFEGFMKLLDDVMDAEKLEPSKRTDLAALFNRYRKEIDIEAL